MTSKRTYYEADLQDPVTGETTTITAETEEELDRLISEHLSLDYPEAP
jgi:hypothetical protein